MHLIQYLIIFLFMLACSVNINAADNEKLKIAVISDLNGSYGSIDYHQQISVALNSLIQQQPDLVISTGDMVAGQRQPRLSKNHVHSMWQAFHKKVSDPIAKAGIPLAVTPGNHDGSAQDYFKSERDIYASQWLARQPALNFIDDSHYPFYYAFEIDGVFFASLDVTLVKHIDTEQKIWLEKLLSASGKDYSHRIVFSHLPVWAVAKGRENDISADRELEALLAKHNVDLYLSGHHHAFYPGQHNGIGYIHQACLGSGPRKLLGTNQASQRAYTLLLIPEQGKITVSAMTGKDYLQPLPFENLPETVISDEATLKRYDL